jgi:hypothetical protein
LTRTDTADLDTRARAWFEAQPHRHPAGRTPEWEMQPEGVRRICALHAARAPWNGRLGNFRPEDREDLPQTVLRAAADALWASDRSTRSKAAACALWAASAELDLDSEGFVLLREETIRLGSLLPLDSDATSSIDAQTLIDVNAVLISLRGTVSLLGNCMAAVPFALAADLVLAAWSFSNGRRRVPLPGDKGRDDAVEIIEGMAFLINATSGDEA